MDLEYLREFSEVADQGSIARAAKSLHLSSSALSRHIQALETDLGTKLFHREENTLWLTSEGEVILEFAIDACSRYTVLKEAFSKTNKKISQLVVGGHVDSPDDIPFVLRAIEQLKRRHPDVQTLIAPLEVCSIERCEQVLMSGREHVLLAFGKWGELAKDHPSLDTELIVRRPWKVLVSQDNQLAEKDKLAFSDISGKTIIRLVGERYNPSWVVLEEELRRRNLSYRTRIVPTVSLYDFLSINPHDGLLFFPPAPNSFLDQQNDQIHIIDLSEEDTFYLDLYAIFLRNPSSALRDFISCLCAEMSS